MSTLPAHAHRITADEYLRRERDSLEKHEFREGQIVQMAGTTANHSLIVANLIREAGNQLKGKPCRVYDSNLRIKVPRTVLYTYPDVTVICGPRQADPDDRRGETFTNPRLIVEVLSPATEGYDRGEKFRNYLTLDSLQEYVLVSQDAPRVETFCRRDDGSWLFTPFAGIDATLQLQSLKIALPLGEIFAGVEWPKQEPPSAKSPDGERR